MVCEHSARKSGHALVVAEKADRKNQDITYITILQGSKMQRKIFAGKRLSEYQPGCDTQVNETYSAVASAAAVLNTLRASFLSSDYTCKTQYGILADKSVQQKVMHVLMIWIQIWWPG
jgi:hypothetical protein